MEQDERISIAKIIKEEEKKSNNNILLINNSRKLRYIRRMTAEITILKYGHAFIQATLYIIRIPLEETRPEGIIVFANVTTIHFSLPSDDATVPFLFFFFLSPFFPFPFPLLPLISSYFSLLSSLFSFLFFFPFSFFPFISTGDRRVYIDKATGQGRLPWRGQCHVVGPQSSLTE